MSEFVDCRTCKTDCVRADGNYGYTFCDKYTHPLMTNADRIRAMNDEELAEFLCDFRVRGADEHPCKGCKAEHYCRAGHTGTIDWLQQPAEEGAN